MSLIGFKSPRIVSEWANQTDERLKIILRAMSVFMGGLRITCLVRTPEENMGMGGVPNSKHLPDPVTGLCCAADLNPSYDEKNLEYWRERFRGYIKQHFVGIDVVIHEGTKTHVHLEIDTLNIPDSSIRLI